MMNKVDLEKIQIIAVTAVMVSAFLFIFVGTIGLVVWIMNNL